jgi:exonuclease III
VKGVNCRGIRQKEMTSYVREMLRVNNFDFICVQHTMVQDSTGATIRRVDPNKNYLWDWSPAKGKFGVSYLV